MQLFFCHSLAILTIASAYSLRRPATLKPASRVALKALDSPVPPPNLASDLPLPEYVSHMLDNPFIYAFIYIL